MMDLYRLLSDHPLPMLRVIAESWGLELQEDDPLQAARALGDAMLSPGALAGRVAALSPEGREALYVLAQSEGGAATKGLALRFGELEHIGPARLERENPWDRALLPLEELVYSGLAFRSYGTVPGGHGELLILPKEVRENLPAQARPAAGLKLPAAPTPRAITDQGYALSEDMLALLCHLRRTQPPAPADDDHLHPPAWLGSDGQLAARLTGPHEAERLALCWRLLWRLNLIEEKSGHLRPSLTAREWLRSPDAARAASLYRAWRDDPRVAELSQLPSVICDPGGCPHDPVATRRQFALALKMLAPGQWHALADVLRELKRSSPTFLRADGDLNSWFIRDAESNQYLRGAPSWDRVEAALATRLLRHLLHWLGLIRLGAEEGNAADFCLGLTPLGAALLSGSRLPAIDRPLPSGQIGTDGSIRVSLIDSAYERYQLERIATWQRQDEAALYALDEDSVWEGYNAGITVEQMAAFLRRLSGDHVPGELTLQMQAWAGRFGRATLHRTTLLVLADEQTAHQIGRNRRIKQLIAERISPTVWAIRRGDIDELTALLKEQGIWPQRKDD